MEKGKFIKKLQPEKRLYVTHEQPTTEVALLSTWQDDLYLVLAGYDEEKQEATFSAYVNPLVIWLWIGGWVMAIGTLLALAPLSREMKTLPNKPPASLPAKRFSKSLRKTQHRSKPVLTD